MTGAWVTVGDAIRTAAARLSVVAENPRLEARLLLAHVLGVTVADLVREPGTRIDPAGLMVLVERRLAFVPIAHLTGHREFWSLDLAVSPATLIPRPDSETLVDAALRLSPRPRRVLDLGTGSGCLLLAILHERPEAQGVGIDISSEALAVARANADRCGVGDRATFLLGDWASAVTGTFDLVVSNPPYIPGPEIASLMPDVALHEPRLALDGGPDGLDAYRRIIPGLPALLTPSGHAVLEVGAEQAEAVSAFGRQAGFHADTRADLAGIARCIVLSARAA